MGTIHVKQAKATEADVKAAIKLASILDAAHDGYMIEEDDRDCFDEDDPDHLRHLWATIKTLMRRHPGSLNRVVWGMSVMLDPENAVVDPDSDVLEFHPDLVRAVESTRWIPVSERLPEPSLYGRRYLVAEGLDWVGEATFVQPPPARNGRVRPPRWERDGRLRRTPITHWMPLPAPPAPESAEAKSRKDQ